MKRSHCAITLLLLFMAFFSPTAHSAPETESPTARPVRSAVGSAAPSTYPTLEAGQPVTGTVSTAYLPLVTQRHRPRRGQDVCPFSLQIAALHQIEPGRIGTAHQAATAQAAWLARYEEAFPTLVDALAASGACGTRLRVDWARIQPDPPPADYVWGPYHDEKLRLVAESGLNLIAHVDGIPEWAGPAACGPIYPERLDEFAQFLTALVHRYKQPPYYVDHWELFNEPDGVDPGSGDGGIGCWGYHGAAYAEMLAVAHAAIKAADPEATVLMGGIAYDWFVEYQGPYYRYFVDDVMAAGGAEHLDALSFHYYPDFHREWERWDPDSPDRQHGWLPAPTCGDIFDGQGIGYEAGGVDLVAKASHFRNRMAACYDVQNPIWVTELAEHGHANDPDSLVGQARYVIQGQARGLAAGVENITWYVLVSPPYDPHEQGLLFEDDWSPKPSYYAYQTLTAELAGFTYAYTLNDSGVESYAFRDEQGQEKVVAWWVADWPTYGSLVFGQSSRLQVVDRDGVVTVVEDGGTGDLDGVQNGAIELRMTVEPVFVSN